MNRTSTLFLRASFILMGLFVLALCIFALPEDWNTKGAEEFRPILLGMYISAVPFFAALYQGLKLLHYVDTNKAFSELSVKALRNIKIHAFIIGGIYTIGLPYLYMIAQGADAPGVLAIGLIIVGTSFSISGFVGLLQKLLQNAIAIKSENDLTV